MFLCRIKVVQQLHMQCKPVGAQEAGGAIWHTHTLRHSLTILSELFPCRTAEVDLINLPFIQTANYAQTHNHGLHGTIESWQRERKEDRGGWEWEQKSARSTKATWEWSTYWGRKNNSKNKVKRGRRASRGFAASKPSTSFIYWSVSWFSLSRTAVDWLRVRIFVKSYLFPISLIKELMLC